MKKAKYISKCCVCGKSKRKGENAQDFPSHIDHWGYHDEELERYYEDYDLIHSHGYCDECAKKAQEEAERWLIEFGFKS